MKEPRIVQVGEAKYTIQLYPTTRGLNLLTEVFLLLGEPVIMMAVGMKDGSVQDLEIKPESIAPIMAGLTSRLSPEKVDEIFKKILDQTFDHKTNRPVLEDYETRFQGEYVHLFQLVWKTLGAQYGDFLGVLGGFAKGSGLANLRVK